MACGKAQDKLIPISVLHIWQLDISYLLMNTEITTLTVEHFHFDNIFLYFRIIYTNAHSYITMEG